MAILEHGSTPAIASGTAGSDLTTASFSPPAGSLVLVMAIGSWGNSSTTTDIYDSLTGTTYTGVYQNLTTGFRGTAAIGWKYFAEAPGSMTVSANFTGLDDNARSSLVVKVLTGVKASDPIGKSNGRNRGDGGTISESITPEALGSRLFVVAGLNDTVDTSPTEFANTDTIYYIGSATFDNAVWTFTYDAPYTTSLSTVALGGTISDTSAGPVVHVEVLASTGDAESASPSDTLGLSDSVGTVWSGSRTFSDGSDLSDNLSTALSANRTHSDALDLSDSVTTALTDVDTHSDTSGLSDSATVALTHVRTFSDDLDLSDAITLAGDVSKVFTDDTGLTDTVGFVRETFREHSDTVGLSDEIETILAGTTSLSDTVTLSDEFSYTIIEQNLTGEIGRYPTTLVVGPGSLYVADLGAVEPEDGAVATEPSAAVWTDLGGILGGVELTIEQEYKTVEFMQVPEAPFRRLEKRRLSVKTELAEPTLANLVYLMNEATDTVTSGSGYNAFNPSVDVSAATQLRYRALLLRGWAPGVDGVGQHKRRSVIMRKCLSMDNVTAKYSKDGQTTFEVTWSVHYVDSDTAPFRVVDET